MNGNWLATGSTDGFVKLYDLRIMKEFETWRVNNGEDSVSSFDLFFLQMHNTTMMP
jgi:WD40 repeat protein